MHLICVKVYDSLKNNTVLVYCKTVNTVNYKCLANHLPIRSKKHLTHPANYRSKRPIGNYKIVAKAKLATKAIFSSCQLFANPIKFVFVAAILKCISPKEPIISSKPPSKRP